MGQYRKGNITRKTTSETYLAVCRREILIGEQCAALQHGYPETERQEDDSRESNKRVRVRYCSPDTANDHDFAVVLIDGMSLQGYCDHPRDDECANRRKEDQSRLEVLLHKEVYRSVKESSD